MNIKNPVLRLAYDKWATNCDKGFDTCLFDETDKQYETVPGSGSLRVRWCGEVFMHVSDIIKIHSKNLGGSVALTATQRIKGFSEVKPIILEGIEKTDEKTEVYDVELFDKYISRMQERNPDASLDLRSWSIGNAASGEKTSEIGGFARITGNITGTCGIVCFTNGSKIFVPSDYDKMVYFSKFLLSVRTHVTYQELFEYWEQANVLYKRYVVDKQAEIDAFLDI